MTFTKQYDLREKYQDGAIFHGLLFRFNSAGRGFVADLNDGGKILGEFLLDGVPDLVAHSNAVMFGTERVNPDDEFPVLYTNLYNTYKLEDDRLEGTLLCYRVFRTETGFSSELLQVIRIGFVEDLSLWKSLPDRGDVRPYGNFVIDRENGALWAFVMRNGTDSTRFFRFALPKPTEGEVSERFGVPTVTLRAEDVQQTFDTPFMRFMQGATMKDGKIYSVEGFTPKPDIPNKSPAGFRVIDTERGCEVLYQNLCELDLPTEPEMIDFDGDILFYGNHGAGLYTVELH